MKDLFDVQQLSQFEFGAIIVTVLIAGLVFGCLLAYWLLKRKNNPDVQATAVIKEEFEEYKDKVDDHFNKTSEMFKDVTTQYKKLYDHMAVGAIALSKGDTINMPRLEMQDSQEPEAAVEEAIIDETQEETPDGSANETAIEESTNSVEPEVMESADVSQEKTIDESAEQNTVKTN